MNLRAKAILLLATAMVIAAVPGLAQTQRGQIDGVITDSTGAVIPAAAVKVINNQTGVEQTTESTMAGAFRVLGLQYGTYTVEVDAPGFQTYRLTSVEVLASSTTGFTIVLSVEAQTEQITVEAEIVPLLQATESSITTGLEEDLMDEMPVLVSGGIRTPMAMIATSSTYSFSRQPTLAGSRAASYEVLLDGQAINGNARNVGEGFAPSMETVGEVTFKVNAAPAEYGRAAPSILTFATKSGSNEFHGSAYEYWRNEELNARPWQAATRNVEKQHEYGISGGGPVLLPGYNGRNKTFFFANVTKYSRRISPSSGFKSLPTPAQLSGDFSDPDILPIYNPYSKFTTMDGTILRDPFPNQMIPSSLFSSVSRNVAGIIPAPNRPGAVNNFVGISRSVLDNWHLTTRVDHQVTSRDRLSLYYEMKEGASESEDVLGASFGGSGANDNKRVRLDWTRNFGPNVIQQVLMGVNRVSNASGSANYGDELGKQWGITGTRDPNCPRIEFDYTLSSAFGICGTGRNRNGNATWTWDYNLTWIKGAHTIKTGFQAIRFNDNTSATSSGGGVDSAMGWYNFGGLSRRSGGIGDFGYRRNTAQLDTTGGNTWADFILGLPASAIVGAANIAGHRETYYGGFIQDDWKITPKLTLNLGLRYDYQVPWHEINGRITSFSETRPNTAAGGLPGALIYYGIGEGREGSNRLGEVDGNNFAPRLGFAYQVNPKTVVRAFAGIIYKGIQSWAYQSHNITGFTANGQPPLPVDPTGIYYNWDDTFPQNVLASSGFDPTFRNGQGLDQIHDPRSLGRPPEAYMWSLGVQRELGKGWVGEMTYLSNNNKHLGGRLQLNELGQEHWGLGELLHQPFNSPDVAAAGFTTPPFPGFDTDQPLWQALRPFPQYQNIQRRSNSGKSSTYHALTLKAQKRFSGGLSFLAQYTMSKYLTDAQWLPGAFGGASRSNAAGHLDKALYRYDTPNRLTLTYRYELPFGRGKKYLGSSNAVADGILGGWQISGFQVYQSGFPVGLSGTFRPANQRIPTIANYADILPNEQVSLRSNISCSDLEFGNPQRNYLLNAGNPAQSQATGRPLAFVPAAPFTLGNIPNLSPNTRQCGWLNENIALTKTFTVKERVRLRIGAEAFNLLNRHTWESGIFGQGVTASNFGEIVPYQSETFGGAGGGGSRAIQLKFRVEW